LRNHNPVGNSRKGGYREAAADGKGIFP
jgi:hypothetical protein